MATDQKQLINTLVFAMSNLFLKRMICFRREPLMFCPDEWFVFCCDEFQMVCKFDFIFAMINNNNIIVVWR